MRKIIISLTCIIGMLVLVFTLAQAKHVAATTTPSDQYVWSKIANNLKLNHASQNPRVQREIRRVLADKKTLETILNRSSPYIYYIYNQTQTRHLPAELALVPIIESEYNPNDHNNIGAAGLWQLMPNTERLISHKFSGGSYGRRVDIVSSTQTALTFVTDLKNNFHNNWNLVFAAYNCGPGCVQSAVRRSGSTDFFKLNVPLETKYYVPRLLAIATIIKHAKQYGVQLPTTKDEPFFTTIKLQKAVTLASYAQKHGISLDVLKKLNPAYKYGGTIALSQMLLIPHSNIRLGE